jgi:hypothetical protein
MANSNRTEIYIEGSKEAIDNFVERFEKCHSGPYPNQEENPHIADEFGADAELFIDKVGSKWIQIWDEGYYRSSDNRHVAVYLDTAWYPPSDMILEIYRQMAEIDDEIKVSGKYWDEGYQPIGVFEVYYGQIIKEENHDLDESEWDEDREGEGEQEYDRNFWEEEVDPAFDKLQEKLDKVMEEI